MNTPPSPFPLELLDRCIHAFRAVQQAPIGTSGLLPFWRSILLTTLEFVLAFDIALWEGSAMGDPVVNMMFNIVLSTMIALLFSIPYWFDRAVTPRLGEVDLRTLVFPAAVTALMFLSSIVPPLNGTQARTLFATAPAPLMQIWALAGLWGFVFLWSWLTACITHVDVPTQGLRTLFACFDASLGWDGARLGWGCLWPSSRWPGGFGGVGAMAGSRDRRDLTPDVSPARARSALQNVSHSLLSTIKAAGCALVDKDAWTGSRLSPSGFRSGPLTWSCQVISRLPTGTQA